MCNLPPQPSFGLPGLSLAPPFPEVLPLPRAPSGLVPPFPDPAFGLPVGLPTPPFPEAPTPPRVPFGLTLSASLALSASLGGLPVALPIPPLPEVPFALTPTCPVDHA